MKVVIISAPMLFAVVAPADNPATALGQRIIATFPDTSLQVSAFHWLIVAGGTTAQEVATKLGIADGSTGSGIVYTTSGYWGRANPQVWEWIRAKMSVPQNA